jgi:hypothetical protein
VSDEELPDGVLSDEDEPLPALPWDDPELPLPLLLGDALLELL